MDINIEYKKRKQKEKAVSGFFSAHTLHIVSGKYDKSRTKDGAFVAWPQTEVLKNQD